MGKMLHVTFEKLRDADVARNCLAGNVIWDNVVVRDGKAVVDFWWRPLEFLSEKCEFIPLAIPGWRFEAEATISSDYGVVGRLMAEHALVSVFRTKLHRAFPCELPNAEFAIGIEVGET